MGLTRTDSHIIFNQAQKTDGTPAVQPHGKKDPVALPASR
jgi:hypothetical protein